MPVRSETSSAVVQKQVGQTIVQFAQVRHRLATSSQCGDSTDARISAGRSTAGISRPIRCAAPLTSARAASCSAADALRCGTPARMRAPSAVPASARNQCPESSMRSVSARS